MAVGHLELVASLDWDFAGRLLSSYVPLLSLGPLFF